MPSIDDLMLMATGVLLPGLARFFMPAAPSPRALGVTDLVVDI